MDQALVSVQGIVKGRQGLNPEEMCSTPGVKVKKSKGSKEPSSSDGKDRKTDTPKVKDKARKPSSLVKKPSTDSKLEKLDQKWLEHFNRLEAMLLSRAFQKPGLVFKSVVVSPAKSPPAGAVDNNQPFFQTQTEEGSHHEDGKMLDLEQDTSVTNCNQPDFYTRTKL